MTAFFYAQLDAAGVAVALTQAGEEITAANMRRLPQYDASVLGRR